MSVAFDFLRYEIAEINYKLVENAADVQNEAQKGIPVKTEISLQKNNDDPRLFRIHLNVTITEKRQISMLLFGYFKWNNEVTSEEAEQCILTNGAMMLYPYARAALSTISVLDGGKSIILPTINVFELFPTHDEVPNTDLSGGSNE